MVKSLAQSEAQTRQTDDSDPDNRLPEMSDPTWIFSRIRSQYLSAPRSTHYAVVLCILRYLKGLSFMAFSTQLSLLLYSVHSLMLIGQEIPLIAGPLRVIAFSLVLFWFLGEVRNKLLWPTPILKQNIVPLLIPHLSSFGYDGFLRI